MSLNDFIFGKILGKGSFGTVNIVTRKQDNKIYAMKRVNISSLSDKDKRSSLNEIRILASLNHPNIIDYKEAFFDEETKTLNIVMEYAEEGDIENKVKENLKHHLRFKENTIWEWIIQILEGLKYLHDNKIMHRDLKCANIFLTKNGILKLGDLNVSIIAKMGMAKTQTGTPYYCSPEIWKDRPYDYKSDIWSLGCIIYELCQLRPPFRGTNLRELSKNVIRGYYSPISDYYSSDLKVIIDMMLRVNANERASTDQLLTHPILKKRIQTARKNIITREIIGKSQKVNFMQTIKLPRNMKDINSKLPKKRYKPEDDMMKNDEYETTKATFYKEKQQQSNNESNGNNKVNFNGNNLYNFGYDQINKGNNVNNNRQFINNYVRKNEMKNDFKNNGFDNFGQMNNYNNMNKNQQFMNKYAYLNKFDNNMNLKIDEKKNNPSVRVPNNNYKEFANNINNNDKNYYVNNEKNYNYHYNEKINNNFDLLFNNNFEKKYNGNMERDYKRNMDNFYNYNNQFKNNNGNVMNGFNNNFFANYNKNRIHPSHDNINKYFQMIDNNIYQYKDDRRDLIQQKLKELENYDKKSEYSNDSDIIKEEYKVKKNENLINDYFNQINIKEPNNNYNNNNNNYFNNKIVNKDNNQDYNQDMNLNNKKADIFNFDYDKNNSNENNNKNKIDEIRRMMDKFNDASNGIKEHEIDKDLGNDKTKDLQQQMVKNQNLFDDLLNNVNNENKVNIGEDELFRIDIPQNNNQEKNNNNANLILNEMNNNDLNFNNIKNNFNNINKNNKVYKSEIFDLKELDLNNIKNSKNNEIEKDKINNNEKKVNTENENGNKREIKMLLHERFQKNKENRKNNYNKAGKNVKKDIKRQVTPNHINNNIQYSYNNNQINNNLKNKNINNKKDIPPKNNKKEEDKYKKKFNEIYEMFPGHNNKVKRSKNYRPESGKPKNMIRPKNINNNGMNNNNINNNVNNYMNYLNENNNINYRMNNNNYNINYNNNNINNYNNIYINNINGNEKLDYEQLFNNKNNNMKYNYNPAINNNKGYLIKNEPMNHYQKYSNNYNNKIEFKYEPAKRQNNKIVYEKFNYNDYLKKKNLENKNGLGVPQNNINDLYKVPNMRKDKFNNNNINNKYVDKNNKNINRRINKNPKMNQPRVKTGGGVGNKLYQKFGFV